MTALMQVYFKVTEGQTANPEWEEKPARVSSKFSELKDKVVAGSGIMKQIIIALSFADMPHSPATGLYNVKYGRQGGFD